MNNSRLNQLWNIRPLIKAMMTAEGRNFTVCEECGIDIIDGKYEIHHKKYKGATYKDLVIVCQSCNRKGYNVGLE